MFRTGILTDDQYQRIFERQRTTGEGHVAYLDGLPQTANPYPAESPLARGWLEGWLHANKQKCDASLTHLS